MNTQLITRSISQNASATPAERALFEGFVAELVSRGRRQKTIESYRSDWTGLCDWWISSHDTPFSADVMGGETAGAFKTGLMERGMTSATINRKLVFLKRYTDFAKQRGVVAETTAREVRGVEAQVQIPRRPRALSDIELRRFIKEIELRAHLRDQAIIFTLLETGLKVSELCELRREQIGLGTRTGLVRLDADTRGRARRVEIGPLARRKLRAWFDERGDHDGPIWDGERGSLTANAVQRMIRKFCSFAHVKVSPQVLRNTFAQSFLILSRGDLVGLADVLGHECLETTRLYVAEEGERQPPVRVHGLARPVALIGGRV